MEVSTCPQFKFRSWLEAWIEVEQLFLCSQCRSCFQGELKLNLEKVSSLARSNMTHNTRSRQHRQSD